MIYCRTCLQPDTRPNTRFDKHGICPACRYFETLAEVDWDERRAELETVIRNLGRPSPDGYDCIIGVSGGKDSLRQALYIKEVLGLNPLLACVGYPPEQVTRRGVENVSNLIYHGFDTLVINPAPESWRNLMRHSFLTFQNWCKSTEMALFAGVPRTAIAYEIPLIIWGENPALQLGDLNTAGKAGWDGNNLRYMNTLAGGNISWMEQVTADSKLLPYRYPHPQEFDQHQIQIIYLGYFWKEWSLIENGQFATLRGLHIREETPAQIGDPQGVTSVDEDWVGMNQMIKYLKFGFGRITDYVNEDVRRGWLTRPEGIALVERYDGCCSNEYIASFSDFIGISVDEFWLIISSCVNKTLFEPTGPRSWRRKYQVGVGL
jgi:N-acetyl sugar amidotransferase